MGQKNLWQTVLFLSGIVCLVVFALGRSVQSANDPVQASIQEPTFEKVVQPFFASHCYTCHNDKTLTANFSLETFKTAASLAKDRAKMKLILDKHNAGDMPPAI